MKTTFLISFLSVFLLFNCGSNKDIQDENLSSEIIQKTFFQGEQIESLKLNSITNATIRNGENFSVIIEAEERYFPFIKTEKTEKTVSISVESQKKYKNLELKKIIITVPTQEQFALHTNSVVDTKTEGILEIKNLSLDFNSVVNSDLHLKVDNLMLKGNSIVSTKLIGSANVAEISINSSVGFNAKDFIVNKVNISTNSSIDTDIYAKELSITANSSVNTQVYGNPKIISKNLGNGASINYN
ncbi:MAG: DUF2807 domain-containing protein [Flavobacteriales bacterium]|nr:DUF2807 domain-containing protein [Flavobacteriales bacterium]